MSARSDTFDRCLRRIVSPRLEALGFTFDKSRSYRRVDTARASVEIVQFQLGQRSMEGRFTVNLGVLEAAEAAGVALDKALPVHCRRQTRIGFAAPPRWPRLERIPAIGFLFGARDRWWRFSAETAFTTRQLEQACGEIQRHGIAWLERQAA